MTGVLPGYTGLSVNSISYQYTTIKQTQDGMIVNIQNQNTAGTGLIFQSADDWSGVPGNTIKKVVPVDGIPYELWGPGEISVNGNGLVVNPSVIYNYSYDPCLDNPLYNPSCPGYADALARMYASQMEHVPNTNMVEEDYSITKTNLPEYYEEKVKLKSPKEMDDEDKRDRKRRGLAAAKNALTEANKISQAEIIAAMNHVPQFQNYYSITIAGGVYQDATMYKPTTVPENKKALRVGLAQQMLHNKMVDQQYDR